MVQEFLIKLGFLAEVQLLLKLDLQTNHSEFDPH